MREGAHAVRAIDPLEDNPVPPGGEFRGASALPEAGVLQQTVKWGGNGNQEHSFPVDFSDHCAAVLPHVEAAAG
jgi:hypothetical protein